MLQAAMTNVARQSRLSDDDARLGVGDNVSEPFTGIIRVKRKVEAASRFDESLAVRRRAPPNGPCTAPTMISGPTPRLSEVPREPVSRARRDRGKLCVSSLEDKL